MQSDINYLKSLIDSLEAGKALILSDQTLASGLVVSMPVYLDDSGVWQAAKLELANNANSTLAELTSKAYVTGMVYELDSALTGKIVISGEVTLTSSILNIVDGAYANGLYYLSTTAGHITASFSTVPVRVCLINGPDSDNNYRVFLMPDSRAHIDTHGHYYVQLYDQPAGDPNCVPCKAGFMWGDLEEDGPYPGVVHVVDNPNSSLPGWLPITDPIFADMAIPAGAKFGYNINQDDDLKAIWPPLPTNHVYATVDGVGETGNKIIVNEDGIWWMDDTYGNAPWPVNLPCIESSSSSSSSSSNCPIWEIRIELWFNKVSHGTNLSGIAEYLEQYLGYQPLVEPIRYSSGITFDEIDGTNVVYMELPDTTNETVTYKLPTRLFASIRRPALSLGFLVSVNVPSQVSSSSSSGSSGEPLTSELALAFASMTLTVSRLKNAAAGVLEILDIDALVPTLVSWDTSPDMFNATAGQEYYFWIESVPIELDPGEVLFFKLNWTGTNVTTPARVYLARPRVISFE
jgi:hypothetical protein